MPLKLGDMVAALFDLLGRRFGEAMEWAAAFIHRAAADIEEYPTRSVIHRIGLATGLSWGPTIQGVLATDQVFTPASIAAHPSRRRFVFLPFITRRITAHRSSIDLSLHR
jgi:hypothetical protein